MLTYTPGETLGHRLDPRTKLAFQFGFAIAAVTTTEFRWVLLLTGVGIVSLWAGGLSVRRALRAYWVVLATLALVPILAGITLTAPYFDIERASSSLQAVSRIVPILLVSAVFVYTTPVRETRAAIQHTIPGRFGQLLGVSVALTVRFIPVVRRDVTQIREALTARGGETRPLRDRAERIAVLSTGRALSRAETLSVALQARCFAWNPTLPRLRFAPIDYPVLVTAGLLALVPLLSRYLL